MPTQEPWEDGKVMSSFSAQTLLGEGHVPPARGVRSPRTRQACCLTLKPRSAAFQLSQIPPRPSLRVPLAPGELRSLPQQEGQRFPQNTHSLCPMTCPAAILPDGHSVVPTSQKRTLGVGSQRGLRGRCSRREHHSPQLGLAAAAVDVLSPRA